MIILLLDFAEGYSQVNTYYTAPCADGCSYTEKFRRRRYIPVYNNKVFVNYENKAGASFTFKDLGKYDDPDNCPYYSVNPYYLYKGNIRDEAFTYPIDAGVFVNGYDRVDIAFDDNGRECNDHTTSTSGNRLYIIWIAVQIPKWVNTGELLTKGICKNIGCVDLYKYLQVNNVMASPSDAFSFYLREEGSPYFNQIDNPSAFNPQAFSSGNYDLFVRKRYDNEPNYESDHVKIKITDFEIAPLNDKYSYCEDEAVQLGFSCVVGDYLMDSEVYWYYRINGGVEKLISNQNGSTVTILKSDLDDEVREGDNIQFAAKILKNNEYYTPVYLIDPDTGQPAIDPDTGEEIVDYYEYHNDSKMYSSNFSNPFIFFPRPKIPQPEFAPPLCAGEQGDIILNDLNGVFTLQLTNQLFGKTYNLDNLSGTGIHLAGMQAVNGEYIAIVSGKWELLLFNKILGNGVCAAAYEVTVPEVPILNNLNAESITTTDEICQTDGTINVNASFNIIPFDNRKIEYRYKPENGNYSAWSGNNQFTGLGSGKYYVEARDQNCPAEVNAFGPILVGDQSFSISPPVVLAPQCSSELASATVSASGTGSFQYKVDNEGYQSSNQFNFISGGEHTFYVKNTENNCEKSVRIDIPSAPLQLLLTASASDVNCYGQNSGSVSLSGAGGTGPYSYSQDNLTYGSADTFSALAAGAHRFYVRDANQCTAFLDVEISQPAAPLQFTRTDLNNPVCFGTSTGSITVSASGGRSPYTFYCDGAEQQTNLLSATYTGKAAGTYTLKVVDSNGCEMNLNEVVVESYPQIITQISAKTDVSCWGGNDGSFTATVESGGSAPFEYSIDNVHFYPNNRFTNLSPQEYKVFVRDAHGCTDSSLIVTVNDGQQLLVKSIQVDSVKCSGEDNGRVMLQVTGSGPNNLRYSTGVVAPQASPLLTGLSAGNHTIHIQDISTGCSIDTLVTIYQPNPLQLKKENQKDYGCYNDPAKGSITVSASGGTIPYRFSLDKGVFSSSPRFDDLASGKHIIEVVDDNNCYDSIHVEIFQPQQLVLSAPLVVGDKCFNANEAQVRVAATGGTPPYTFLKDSEAAFGSSNLFNNLTAGKYIFWVKDANDCMDSIELILQPGFKLKSTISTTTAECSGYPEGTITANVLNSQGPFRYSLIKEGMQLDQNNNGVFAGLISGSYQLQIMDESTGCSIVDTVLVQDKYPLLSFDVVKIQPSSCNASDGQVSLSNIQGGVPPYQFSFADQKNFSQNTQFTGLQNGMYTLFIKDGMGCISEHEISLGSPFSVHYMVEPINCIDNKAKITVDKVEGSPGLNYEYALDNAPFGPEKVFSQLDVGNYVLKIRDIPFTCQAKYTINITNPIQLTLSDAYVENMSCKGNEDGKIALRVKGGKWPYLYSLNGSVFRADSVFTGLSKGSYSFIVKDQMGCELKQTVSVAEPDALSLVADTIINLNCYQSGDGFVKLNAQGGNGHYVFVLDGGNEQNDPVFSGLSAGNHTAVVRDSKGCFAMLQFTLIQPDSLKIMLSSSQAPLCARDHTGLITLSSEGGTGRKQYALDGIHFQSSATFDGLAAGQYVVTVKDERRCTKTLGIDITAPLPLVAQHQVIQEPICHNQCDGLVNVICTGGVQPYSIEWENRPDLLNNFAPQNLCSGSIAFKVTDKNGCQFFGAVTLKNPDSILVNLGPSVTLCTGQIHELDAGYPGSNYTWSSDNGFNSQERTVRITKAGVYHLKVVTRNGCEGQATFLLKTNQDLLKSDFVSSSEVVMGDTVIVVDISNPKPSGLRWEMDGDTSAIKQFNSPTDPVQKLVFVKPGFYGITLYSALGECKSSLSKSIKVVNRSEEITEQLKASDLLIDSYVIYPNPSDGLFQAQVKLKRSADITLQLINIDTGSVIEQKNLTGSATYSVRFEKSELKQGLYLLLLKAGKERKNLRLVRI
ncbi:SprB repeat-containing protein [Solitalea koreensis]|uniref:SprB repeat-containing protein n=1 Tax=Solitalea koreensis TaxID=543615 RepID=UPI00163DD2FF|nr:SprB repeat-containing protein [Solitalea koreensis]